MPRSHHSLTSTCPTPNNPAQQSLSDTTTRHTWRERRAFEYYFRHFSLVIAGFPLDNRFWHGIVLQLCRSEPAVWDAIIAVSALYESPDHPVEGVGAAMVRPAMTKSVARHHREPMGWYFRSMAGMKDRIGRNRASAFLCLVTCVLYLCLENMQGHAVEALQLFEQGVRLLELVLVKGNGGMLRKGSYERTVVEEVVGPIFGRLGVSALVSTGYPCPVQDWWDRKDVLCVRSMEELRDTMVSLNAEAIILAKAAYGYFHAGMEEKPEHLQALFAQQHALGMKLQGWRTVFTTLQDKHPQTNPTDTTASVLLTFHIAASIMVSTCLSQRQLPFDNHIDQFRDLIEHARTVLLSPTSHVLPGSRLPFTFETGPGLPLYYAAVKCRDASLRREALSLLKQAAQVQAFFNCSSWIRLAEMAIQLEEGDVKGLQLKIQTQSYTGPIDPAVALIHESHKYQEWLVFGKLDHKQPVVHEVARIAGINAERFFMILQEPESRRIPEEQRLNDIGVTTAYRFQGDALNKYGAGIEHLLQHKTCEEVFVQFTRSRLDPTSGEWEQDRFFLSAD
ncbi:C6 finger domain protein [Aspergillus affinis]|uniref:C6 finger domain protein n=1 Tax=Aspergillus affinis TaxID=1070780 RepID=UPI0022FF0D5E|nr:C6 finger domain protein [Aspergillus affinis]KAI9046234.1 C6 finger domain protein [Aspergillus affinis]